jgi:OOP family OmpA-OmpF porin
MSNKTRLLAGMALGCVLTTPAAFAEEYRGFYFGLWGGTGEYDTPSRSAMDAATLDILDDEVAMIPIQPDTNLAVNEVFGSTQDDSLSPWGAQVGYRFNKWVAAEIGYVDLGEFLYNLTGAISGDYAFVCDDCGEDGDPALVTVPLNGGFERGTQLTSAGVTASVLGMLPVGQRFDFHVRGGIYYADTRVTNRLRYIDAVDQEGVFNLLHRRVDASQTELFGGLGAAWNINESFTLRVEYQKFFDVGDDEKAGETDVDVLNVAVLFK